MIKKKIKLFAILFLSVNACFSQMSHEEYLIRLNYYDVLGHAVNMYEIKDISEVLSIETEYLLIDPANQDTSRTNNKIEYFDGQGNLVFFKGDDFEMDETRLWLKQYDQSFQHFNIYTNDVKNAHYSKKTLDDTTSLLEFYHPELSINTSIALDAFGIHSVADSVYRTHKFDAHHNFSEVEFMDKKKGDLIFIHYEILHTDKRNNWTKRIAKMKYGYNTVNLQETRQIKYSDEYNLSKYFEIKVDTLILNDQLISDPEILNPGLREGKVGSIDEEKHEQKQLYKAVSRLFHKKYFNKKYFMQFSTTDQEVAEILEERLFKYLRSYVFDIENEKFYTGRTRSKRWFDHSRSFKTMQETEAPPSLTENWIEINGYQCREYVKKSINGKDEKFYVTEDLPFINYCDFTFTLPGFILKSTRHIPDLGEVELTVNINQCKYPFYFLEFLNELNEKYETEMEYLQRKP